MKIFFICGAPKSGTTWLQRLLDAHPNILCSGEGHFIEKMVLPIFKIKQNYNDHLKLVAERVYQGKPYYDALHDQDLLPLVRSLMIGLMTKRRKPGATVVGDKTPRYTEFLPQLHAIFPESKFIHIIRDPRDVVVSVLHHANRAGYGDALIAGSKFQNENIDHSSSRWVKAMTQFASFAEAHPQSCLELRYEDLSERPHEQMQTTCKFLGVRANELIIGNIVSQSSFEAWSGRKPGQEDSSSFFRKGVVADWKNVLDAAASGRIAERCHVWMVEKGYMTDDQLTSDLPSRIEK